MRFHVNRLDAEKLREDLIAVGAEFPVLPHEGILVPQVAGADAASRHFFRVGGSDAPPRGADFLGAQTGFAGAVKDAVLRQDHVGLFADEELPLNLETVPFDLVDFLHKPHKVHHHAVADDAHHRIMEDTGGNQVQDVLLAVDDNGMARVVAPLIARNHVHLRGHVVHDFSLSFISPLATYDDRNGH